MEQRVIKSLHKIQPATILGIAQHITEEWRPVAKVVARLQSQGIVYVADTVTDADGNEQPLWALTSAGTPLPTVG